MVLKYKIFDRDDPEVHNLLSGLILNVRFIYVMILGYRFFDRDDIEVQDL